MRGFQFVIVNDVNMSEKPAGATHYGPPIEGYIESWFRLTEAGFERWNGSAWGASGALTFKRFSSLIQCEEPVKWDGQGNPPAGTICEVDGCSTQTGWGLCEIRYSGADVVVFKREMSLVESVNLGGNTFRALPTQAQLANAKREDDAIELYQAVMPDKASARWETLGNERRDHFRSLVDQGWQKVPRE